jgi:hypothetical protein
MRRWILAGLAACALLFPVAATAATTADQPYAGWLAEAQMPEAPTVEVVGEERCIEAGDEPGLGCTDMATFIALSPEAGPHTFLHEEGHIFAGDHVYGSAEVESRIAGLIGHPQLVWHELAGNDSSLDEAFADSYARCGLAGFGYPILAKWRGGYSVGSIIIESRSLRRLCGYIRSL